MNRHGVERAIEDVFLPGDTPDPDRPPPSPDPAVAAVKKNRWPHRVTRPKPPHRGPHARPDDGWVKRP